MLTVLPNGINLYKPIGQATYTGLSGVNVSYTFTVPLLVTSICVLVVGPGGTYGAGGGGGGGLAYVNNLTVTPGTSYTVSLSTSQTYFNTSTYLYANKGNDGGTAGGTVANQFAGGGGAPGWTATGGAGGYGNSIATYNWPGGAGGTAGGTVTGVVARTGGAGGQGQTWPSSSSTAAPTTSGGTTGGTAGFNTSANNGDGVSPYGSTDTNVNNKIYGRGLGGRIGISLVGSGSGNGLVRIIWGPGRSFPSTLTADQ